MNPSIASKSLLSLATVALAMTTCLTLSVLTFIVVSLWDSIPFIGRDLYANPDLPKTCPRLNPLRIYTIIVLPAAIAVHGWRKSSLSRSGAICAVFVGTIMCMASYSFVADVLTFFFTSSRATRYRWSRKAKMEVGVGGVPPGPSSGNRNWIQVISNAGMATELSLLYIIEAGGCVGHEAVIGNIGYPATTVEILALAILAAISAASADTWASELGSAWYAHDDANHWPRLITTGKRVPPGTNGAVTLVGLIFSAFGGSVVGLAHGLTSMCVSSATAATVARLTIFGAVAGLFGSVVDSILGATLQFSGRNKLSGAITDRPPIGDDSGDNIERLTFAWPLLDNHAVNLLTTIITALASPWLGRVSHRITR